jgi:hypothetical protein
MRAGCPRTRAAACGQDARVPGPLHAGRMPAYPGRCMRAGCPRTQTAACGQDARVPRPLPCGQDARVPRPLHAGKMPAYPDRCMRARSPHTRAGGMPAYPGGAETRTVPARQKHLTNTIRCPGRNAPRSLVSTVAIPSALHQRGFEGIWHRLNTLL